MKHSVAPIHELEVAKPNVIVTPDQSLIYGKPAVKEKKAVSPRINFVGDTILLSIYSTLIYAFPYVCITMIYAIGNDASDATSRIMNQMDIYILSAFALVPLVIIVPKIIKLLYALDISHALFLITYLFVALSYLKISLEIARSFTATVSLAIASIVPMLLFVCSLVYATNPRQNKRWSVFIPLCFVVLSLVSGALFYKN